MVYSPLSDQERSERRQGDRDRLEQAARELLASDGWIKWVKVRSANGLARYSFGNQLLIALQQPDASYVAGFRAFLKLNRCVRKGERAIRILAPITTRARGTDPNAPLGEESQQPGRTLFRGVCVFDVAQTDPLPGTSPTPLTPPSEPIRGDTHAHYLAPLERLADELGYTVGYIDVDGSAEGGCDAKAKRIVIDDGLAGNAKVRVLVHELAHALGVNYTDYTRQQAEVLVDTVTYIVCGSVGLDVSGSSIPYVAGWGEDGSLDAIRTFAQTIDRLARQIETTIDSPAEPATAT